MQDGAKVKVFTYPDYFKEKARACYPHHEELHELIEANDMNLPLYELWLSENKDRDVDENVRSARRWLSDEWGRLIEIYMDGETESGW